MNEADREREHLIRSPCRVNYASASLSQPIEVDFGPDVFVGHGRRQTSDGVIVVSGSEDLVLHGGAVVEFGVEVSRKITIEHSARPQRAGAKTGRPGNAPDSFVSNGNEDAIRHVQQIQSSNLRRPELAAHKESSSGLLINCHNANYHLLAVT